MPTINPINRRPTMPMSKSDTKELLEYFLFQQEVKTLPEKNKQSSTVVKDEKPKKSSKEDERVLNLKRTDSYRRATHRDSVGNGLDITLHEFRKRDYDPRKYVSLPSESKSKRKSSGSVVSIISNNNNNNNNNRKDKSKHIVREYSQTGNLPSPDTDDDDDCLSTSSRHKKSTFKRAKERILQTFSKQKKTEEDKKIKNKNKNNKRTLSNYPETDFKHTHSKSRHSSSIENVTLYDVNGDCNVDVTTNRKSSSLTRITTKHSNVHDQSDYRRRSDSRDDRTIPGEYSQNRSDLSSSISMKGPTMSRMKSIRQSIRRKMSSSESPRSPRDEHKGNNLIDSHGQRKTNYNRKENSFKSDTQSITDIFEAIINDNPAEERDNVICEKCSRNKVRCQCAVDRSNLTLPGLLKCHSFSTVTTSQTDEVTVKTKRANWRNTRSPNGQTTVYTRSVLNEIYDLTVDGNDVTPSYDVPDGEITGVNESKGTEKPKSPTANKSTDNKKLHIENVANRLAKIADNYVSQVESESTGSEDDSSHKPTVQRLTSLEMDFLVELRKEGDRLSSTINMPGVVVPFAIQLVKEATHYNKFKTVVERALGQHTVGWNEIAMYFYLTKAAVRMAGTGGAVAKSLTDMALDYFTDRFSSWVVDNGGWDSMLEEETTTTDSELD